MSTHLSSNDPLFLFQFLFYVPMHKKNKNNNNYNFKSFLFFSLVKISIWHVNINDETESEADFVLDVLFLFFKNRRFLRLSRRKRFNVYNVMVLGNRTGHNKTPEAVDLFRKQLKSRMTPCCPVPVLQLLACHGEDADHQVDAPVAQQRHLCLIPLALLGFPFGLDGSPDADPEDQQVEENHDGHSGDVESHDGAVGFRVKDRASAGLPG